MELDFFGSNRPETDDLTDNVDNFAKAVAERSILNPAMSANLLAPTKKPISTNNFRSSSSFGFLDPNDLLPLTTTPTVLIIDIRPHAAYSSARIPTALSLSVPSTLLKRPLFSLDKLAAMLPSPSARARFSEWPNFSTIVVYDVDSTGSPHLPEGNNILGLLRKFSNDASYSGNTLLWLKGGFQRVWRERRDLVDLRPPDLEAEDDTNDSSSLKTNQLPFSAFGSTSTTSSPQKRPPSVNLSRSNAPTMSDKPAIANAVPFNPFFDTIRQNLELSHGATERIPLRLPKRVRKRINDLPFEWLRVISRRADIKLEESTSSDSVDSDDSSEQPRPILPPGILYLPLAATAAHRSSSPAPESKPTPPPPNQAILDEGMEALAMQFYRIELAEQRRLMGVMKYHSAESGVINLQQRDAEGSVDSADESMDLRSRNMSVQDTANQDIPMLVSTSEPRIPEASTPHSAPATEASSNSGHYRVLKSSHLGSVSSGPPPSSSISESDSEHGKGHKSKHKFQSFPFSITAGVEKGAKNRYRHIWPFEHARVRLHQRRRSPAHAPTSPTSIPSLKIPRALSPRAPSGALTGAIHSVPGPGLPFNASAISHSASDVIKSSRSPQMKARRGIKPSFGAGGLGLGRVPSPFSTSALTAPVLSGLGPSTFGGSALKPSFTSMRAPAPAAGSGGETTESEHDDSERETSGKEEPKSEEYDDYVNASFVQPMCTSKRYIATQGPLEATFVDFWTLVYQQNVHVIVMLTREIEGSMVKCGPYWKDDAFGPLRLQLIKVEGDIDEGKDDDVKRKAAKGGTDHDATGFSFPTMSDASPKKKNKKDSADAIIKRTFLLSHVGYPHIPPRKVVQLQYLEWPDMNVPDDPRGVLGLIREVDQAVTDAMHLNEQEDQGKTFKDTIASEVPAEVRPSIILPQSRTQSEESLDRYTGIATKAMGRKHSPVLLHCSAGVGRTGGFIVVDAVLDGIRREVRKKRQEGNSDAPADAMDVDIVVEDEAVGDGQGNWNRSTSNDVDMSDSQVGTSTIAMPANNNGDVLHIPVHTPRVRYLDFSFGFQEETESNDDLLTPTAPFPPLSTSFFMPQDIVNTETVKSPVHSNPNSNSNSGSSSASRLRTPMQLDSQLYSVLPANFDGVADTSSEKKSRSFQRQSSSTRMWAEDVSDQTGSHGTAVRVDEARRQMLSEDRLSEWDAPTLNYSATAGVSHSKATSSQEDAVAPILDGSEGVEMDQVESFRQSMQGHSTVGIASTQAQAAPAFPLSSIDSSSSEDSYGFQNVHGHQAMQLLPYGKSALTSSMGTSLSSLQSLPGSLMSKSSSPQFTNVGEGLLPALKLRGEDLRLRTLSAPSGRLSEGPRLEANQRAKVDETSSSPLILAYPNRMMEMSPSPFRRSKGYSDSSDDFGLPHPRSLSPSDAPVSSLPSPQRHTDDSSLPQPSNNSNGSNSTSAPTVNIRSEPRSRTAPETSIMKSLSLPNPESSTGPPKAPYSIVITDSKSKADVSRYALHEVSQPSLPYPRTLHSDQSPEALSEYEEPLMEVLRDMREQRMSLCQSLRQYVFVHAAVIEGALMIVDEERERERKEMEMDVDDDDDPLDRHMRSSSAFSSSSLSSPVRHTHRAISISSTPSTGKRVASPTELPKEDKKGDQVLFKKPSIKRKSGASQPESWGFRARSGAMLHPPPP